MSVENIEREVESRIVDRDVILSAIEVVQKFIVETGRILYGGQALDFVFKLATGVGLYRDTALPDYDFMSPASYEDSINLIMRLDSMSFQYVSTVNAIHSTTRRVRVRFYNVADITYVPKNVFDKIPFLEYKGMKVVHPDYQRMDMHSSMSFPLENPPTEVLQHRIKKDIKRFGMLDDMYPLKSPKLKIEVMQVSRKLPDDCLLTGFGAFCFYKKKLLAKVGTHSVTFEVDGESVVFEAPYSTTAFIVKDIGVLEKEVATCTDFRWPFMDTRSAMASGAGVEVYFLPDKVSLYNVNDSGIKVVSVHQLCLYFLQAYFERDDPIYLQHYVELLEMIKEVMIGSDDELQKLFFIPCERSWGKSFSSAEKLRDIDFLQKMGILPQKKMSPPNVYMDKGTDEVATWDYSPFYYRMSGEPISREEYWAYVKEINDLTYRIYVS